MWAVVCGQVYSEECSMLYTASQAPSDLLCMRLIQFMFIMAPRKRRFEDEIQWKSTSFEQRKVAPKDAAPSSYLIGCFPIIKQPTDALLCSPSADHNRCESSPSGCFALNSCSVAMSRYWLQGQVEKGFSRVLI